MDGGNISTIGCALDDHLGQIGRTFATTTGIICDV
jgi:hypothetical protein